MKRERKQNFVSKQNESQPLFENKWLERMTRTHIAVPVSIFFLYAIGLVYYTKVATDLANWQVLLLFFGGWLVFTFAEYKVHKGLYHMHPKTDNRKKIAYTMHGIHHDYPKDKNRLAMPPVLSVLVGTILLLILEFFLDIYSFSFLAGFLTGYAFYLLVHYSVHIFRAPNNFLKVLWTNHAIHHYSDDTVLFGVSSPLWDHIFGTLPQKKSRRGVEVKAGV